MNHPLPNMIEGAMSKIRELVDVNSVVGEPIVTPDGVTLIPICKVSIGCGAGGTDIPLKSSSRPEEPFGGGTGAGVKITPIAFLVLRGESVRMLPVAAPANTTADRVVELLPDLLEKLSAWVEEKKAERAKD